MVLTGAPYVQRLVDQGALPTTDYNTEWIGGYYLGEGGFGFVTTFILVDKTTRRPLDRMVVKDTWDAEKTKEPPYYDGIYHDLCEKGLDWGISPSGVPGTAKKDERFLREAYMQSMMTDPSKEFPDDLKSIPLRGWARMVNVNKQDEDTLEWREMNHWRLFMPLYDYGTLDDLIEAHKKAHKAIPEPFIWYALQCLMKGARQLELQARERSALTSNDDVIIMCDLKPQNIFLGPPNLLHFPVYPEAHLADFGGAQLTHSRDPLNLNDELPQVYTPGWRAPEQVVYSGADENGTYTFKAVDIYMHNWTNVWQIGRIIEALMRLEQSAWERPFHLDGCYEWEKESDILSDPPLIWGTTYSQDLCLLVYDCQRLVPRTRPTPDDALRRFHTEGHRHFQGMEDWGTSHNNDQRTDAKRNKENADKAAGIQKPTPSATDLANKRKQQRENRLRAHKYTRTWPHDHLKKYLQLDEHVPKHLELEFKQKHLDFADATDGKLEFLSEHGVPTVPLQYHLVNGNWEKKTFDRMKVERAQADLKRRNAMNQLDQNLSRDLRNYGLNRT